MFQGSDTDSDGGNEATPIDDMVNTLTLSLHNIALCTPKSEMIHLSK